MASGNVTNAGNVLLQTSLSQIAEKMTLYGLSKGSTGNLLPLNVAKKDIAWGSTSSNGITTSGVVTFGVGNQNMGTGITWVQSDVHGVELLDDSGILLLKQSLGPSDPTTVGSALGGTIIDDNYQASFIASADGITGKYTVASFTVNFT